MSVLNVARRRIRVDDPALDLVVCASLDFQLRGTPAFGKSFCFCMGEIGLTHTPGGRFERQISIENRRCLRRRSAVSRRSLSPKLCASKLRSKKKVQDSG